MNETNVDGAPEAEPSSAEASEGSGKHGGRKKRPFRTRRWLAGLLVVLFSISLFATVLSVWGARQVLNTDVFVSHIDTAIKNPAVQESIADYVTKELVQAVDPAKKISAVLPKKAQVIVPPVVSGLEDFVHSAVQKFVASPQFQRLFLGTVRTAHANAVALLEGKTKGNLVIHGNEVVLNTLPLIDATIRQLEEQNVLTGVLAKVPPLATTSGSPSQQVQALSHRLGVTLPADFGQVVVFHSTSLQQAQEGLKKLHRSLVLILVLTVVLFALALVVAPFKLRTLAQLGIGAAIVGLLTWAGTMWATNHIVQLVKAGHTKAAIRAILDAETGGLTELVILIAVIGAIAALLAFVFGESPQAGRIRAAVGRATARLPAVGRGALAFTNAHAGGARVLGYVVGLAILFIWLTWTAFFVALAVVVLWQVAVALIERAADSSSGEPPSGDGQPQALGTAQPAPQG